MATARTAAVLGLEELAQADGALGSRGNQRHDLLGELSNGFETDFRSSRRWSCLARIAEAPEALIFEVE